MQKPGDLVLIRILTLHNLCVHFALRGVHPFCAAFRSYMDAQAWRPSLAEVFEDYWTLMPQ